MIVNPPIIFGKTIQLLCSPVTPNISYSTHNITSWLGGKDYSTLTYNGNTADPIKYAEIRRWHSRKFDSILQIYKFDEMDVNVNYSCSIGGCETRKTLSLTPDKFEC
jgi:glycyl-tRNA synthetase alpha subunit